MNRLKLVVLTACILLMYGCFSERKNTTEREHTVTQNQELTDSSNRVYAIADTMYEAGETSPQIVNLRILYNNHIIFSDSNLVYEAGIQYVSYHDSVHYALFNSFDPISSQTLCVLRWTTTQNAILDKVTGQLICDIDNDGITEIIGQGYTDAVCTDCDSCYYSPVYVWKLQEKCTINETLTQELTSLKFGCYMGFQPSDTILQCRPIEYNSIPIW